MHRIGIVIAPAGTSHAHSHGIQHRKRHHADLDSDPCRLFLGESITDREIFSLAIAGLGTYNVQLRKRPG